jgi:integrase
MPRAPKFTDRTIKEKAKPGKLLHVSGTSNLYLRTSGKKRKQRWEYRFSRPDGSGVTTKSLGPYPAVTIEIAKNRAEHARLIMARDKINPFEVDWDDGATKTFGEVTAEWIEENKSSWKTEKQFRDAKHLLLVVGKELVDKPIQKIKAPNIRDALKARCKDTPKQVKRALGLIERVFNYAKVNHWFFGENPANWKEKLKILFPELSKLGRGHFEAMPYEDVPEFFSRLRPHQNDRVPAIAVEFCALTVTRPGETLGMQWSEVDLENRIWTIPAERMKAGRGHRVPLCARACEILKRRKEHAGNRHHVFFAGQRDKQMDDKSMRNVPRKMGVSADVHGFRSSFRDWCGEQHADFGNPAAVEMCLAHSTGKGNADARSYFRSDLLEQRRPIMEAWASYCG